MESILNYLGQKTSPFFAHFYSVFALFFAAIGQLRRAIFYRRQIIEQQYFIGVTSLPLVLVISIFTGLVTSVQAFYQTQNSFVPKYLIAAAIYRSIVIELGPVMTGLVLAGRIGAGMTAEIGTMKVSEQIDALKSLALDPVGFLAMPRILAGIFMFPILTIFAEVIAIGSGFLMSFASMGISQYEFIRGMQSFYQFNEIMVGLVKAMFFGMFVTLVGSYMGLNTKGGAKGVGVATTASVVTSLVLILVLDYLVADIFF
jgi:phospholipid/cholesterol/gamma-HCH transport system permease protein